MKHGSLFSGIGGFDLAAQWMGWENIFHCENNPFGKRVLNHYWPNTISYDDIKKADFTIHRGSIDVLSGGFPCQPYSTAGKRLGKEDERHLWPEMLRAIREIQPRWVVGENVRGLTNWNGGLVFDEVQADLEAEGYQVLPFLLPACAVNAPHRRDRIWFVAYAGGHGGIQSEWQILQNRDRDIPSKKPRWEQQPIGTVVGSNFTTTDPGKIAAHSSSEGLSLTSSAQRRKIFAAKTASARSEFGGANAAAEQWCGFPTQSPVCSGDDGVPTKLVGITVPKHRNESIKGYGNAVVPELVFELFKVIDEMERFITQTKQL